MHHQLLASASELGSEKILEAKENVRKLIQQAQRDRLKPSPGMTIHESFKSSVEFDVHIASGLFTKNDMNKTTLRHTDSLLYNAEDNVAILDRHAIILSCDASGHQECSLLRVTMLATARSMRVG